jgi:putative drug exporter of the RND superfamily
MFTTLGRFAVRRRRLVLAFTALFVALSAVLGTGVFGVLQGGGFDDPSSESTTARLVLQEEYGVGDPNVVLLVTAPQGVDDPTAVADGMLVTERLSQTEGIVEVASYWSLGNAPPLRSTDGTQALIVARITGTESEQEERYHLAYDALSGTQGSVTVGFGGQQAIFADLGETIESDLVRAELIAIPITLVLLVLVFGGLVAAGLPLFVAIIAVFGTFLSLYAIAQLTDVSIYAINLTTALGLGLAIDYSLFIVNRYREELAAGLAPHDAVVRTVETAGRTVAFSALTVAASLSALLVFPLYFLRSFAYAGTAVVVIAALGAVVALPSLLAVTGHRVNSLRLFGRNRAPKPLEAGLWHRLATGVMKRPLPVATAVVAVLILLGLPFLNVSFGSPDERTLPASSSARQVTEAVRTNFDGNSSESFAVVIDGIGDPSARVAELDALASMVAAQPGVARVTGLTGTYAEGQLVLPPDESNVAYQRDRGTWLTVVPDVRLVSEEGESLVKGIRSIDTTLPVAVDGQAAELIDTKAAIFDRLPLALAIIALVTFVLLFLVFGSILVPIKAIVLNLLSLTATFGAMVWVFQQGNLSGFLDFTATGQLDVSMPILMFCIAFGLSMDYEVFLLSRIKEEYDLHGDNSRAVAAGMEKTGRIITAAAALLAVTFVAFGTSGVTIIKLFGLGLALAIVMDATIVRGLLVPAFMRLAGDANWWAPAPLKRFQQRFGIHEGDGPAPAKVATAPAD